MWPLIKTLLPAFSLTKEISIPNWLHWSESEVFAAHCIVQDRRKPRNSKNVVSILFRFVSLDSSLLSRVSRKKKRSSYVKDDISDLGRIGIKRNASSSIDENVRNAVIKENRGKSREKRGRNKLISFSACRSTCYLTFRCRDSGRCAISIS